jgi:signal transduction histidine kinase
MARPESMSGSAESAGSGRTGWRWRLPARTIRLRLALLYGGVFLITGAGLLTIGYLLVRNNLQTRHTLSLSLDRLGLGAYKGQVLNRALGGHEANLVRAVQDQIVAQTLHRLLWEYIGALVATTMIAITTGWLLAGRALRPLRDITATARRVSGENLGERIALQGPRDELRELADTFDRMLARLDAAFASQRHFVANASHELRTPLAIMRTEIDVALADPDASREELRAMGEAIREMVDRSERLIAGLLVLARSQAAAGPEEPTDLAALAGDCITDLHARAVEAQVEIHDDLEPAWTSGEPALLERMVANLLDNGIHHNEPDGCLDVSTRVTAGRVVLDVRNGGAPIDPATAAQLTQPFRRVDRRGEGFGLGLSIVRSVAEAHGGSVTLAAPPSGGLQVVVSLPALTGAAAPARNVAARAFSHH